MIPVPLLVQYVTRTALIIDRMAGTHRLRRTLLRRNWDGLGTNLLRVEVVLRGKVDSLALAVADRA